MSAAVSATVERVKQSILSQSEASLDASVQRIKDSVMQSESESSLHIDAEVERIKNAVIQSEKSLPTAAEQEAMVSRIVSSVIGSIQGDKPGNLHGNQPGNLHGNQPGNVHGNKPGNLHGNAHGNAVPQPIKDPLRPLHGIAHSPRQPVPSKSSLAIDAEVKRITKSVAQSEKISPSHGFRGNGYSNVPNDPVRNPVPSESSLQIEAEVERIKNAVIRSGNPDNLVTRNPIGTIILPIMPPQQIKTEKDDLDLISQGQTAAGDSASPRKRKKKMKDSLNEAIYLSGSESDPECKVGEEIGQNLGEHSGGNVGENMEHKEEHLVENTGDSEEQNKNDNSEITKNNLDLLVKMVTETPESK